MILILEKNFSFLDQDDRLMDDQVVFFYQYEDPRVVYLKSPGCVNFSSFFHCKYVYKLYGKLPTLPLLQSLFIFFLVLCKERVHNLVNEMFSWLHWKYDID
jgi:hypothetical protein